MGMSDFLNSDSDPPSSAIDSSEVGMLRFLSRKVTRGPSPHNAETSKACCQHWKPRSVDTIAWQRVNDLATGLHDCL